MQLADLDLDKIYSYADYIKWQFEERVELIKGRIFPMSAPNARHQTIAMDLSGYIWSYLKNKPCKVFSAPFDVMLTTKTSADKEIMTIVQPDICVVCDESKIEMRGCVGAPDIIIEILSPGNNAKELKNKFNIYEESGVLEYWIVYPQNNSFIIYRLANGKYIASRPFIAGDVITTPILPGFSIDLQEFFDRNWS